MATKNKGAAKSKAKSKTKPKKLVLSKKDIEASLANMERWCSALRQALEVYDRKSDKAVLYYPPPGIIIEPPPNGDVVDCPPPEEAGCCCCCCSLTPELVELLTEYLAAWKRNKKR